MARAKYLESQNLIRREMLMKRSEKENSKIIDELIWGVPKGSQRNTLQLRVD
jgi:meiotic recombination protein REC8